MGAEAIDALWLMRERIALASGGRHTETLRLH